MRPGATRITTRFFVALLVLLGSLAAGSALGLHGLQEVQRANDQVFSDNLQTAEATSQLAIDLGSAERIGLEIADINGLGESDELRARLDRTVVPKVNADIARLVRLHADDPPWELAQLSRVSSTWKAVALTEGGPLESVGQASTAAQRSQAADAVADVMDPLILFVSARQLTERRDAAAAHAGAKATYHRDRTWLMIVAAAALAAAIVMLLVGLALKRIVDQRTRDAQFEASASEYIETLQVTESEDEAHELLRRQVERSIDAARAVVLLRNNSADRLEAKTSLADLDPLGESLGGATPRSCLSVRSGREHTETADGEQLLRCEICGGLPGASTCQPLLVGGEVIGVVLISHPGMLDDGARQRVRETVAQAAPVLANLRNLATAQREAATDGLTGLPNQRAVQDTLKRMVALSARTASPLAALLVDLDHFKNVNDVYGHDRGDEVLAATGAALRNAVRGSDFVGRYGGEEFLLLLPDTDRHGGLHVAEAVRAAIETMHLPNVTRITASVGVALHPVDAIDAVTLFRSADRALYSAKKGGRNRVETIAAEDEGSTVLAAAPAADTR